MSKSTSKRPGPAQALSHLNDRGEATMVDVSEKPVTQRKATAQGFVSMQTETLKLIETGQAKKGDVLATARIAGILAAKKTHDLIPLCHPLAITKVTVDFEPGQDPAGINVTAEVRVSGQTGVEMEALTAVSIACLTIYDMLKAVDKGMTFSNIQLLEKTGGRSGQYRRTTSAAAEKTRSGGPMSRKGRKARQSPQVADPPAGKSDPGGKPCGDPPWDI